MPRAWPGTINAAPLQGSSVRVNPKTGFILEADARQIEIGGQAAESDAIITPGAVSSTTVTLSRTDNILSNVDDQRDDRNRPARIRQSDRHDGCN